MKRCDWLTENKIYIDYHDKEWGVPLHDDRKLFEMLILEGVQAGLSWLTIMLLSVLDIKLLKTHNTYKATSCPRKSKESGQARAKTILIGNKKENSISLFF